VRGAITINFYIYDVKYIYEWREARGTSSWPANSLSTGAT
jgi:hypothetical protein